MNVITVMHGCMLHEVLKFRCNLTDKESLERCHVIPTYTAQLNQCRSTLRLFHYKTLELKHNTLRYDVCPPIMYSTGTLHVIGGNTTCRATSVSNSTVKEHKQSHFTCGNYIGSDTVFSEARVVELIDRERDKV